MIKYASFPLLPKNQVMLATGRASATLQEAISTSLTLNCCVLSAPPLSRSCGGFGVPAKQKRQGNPEEPEARRRVLATVSRKDPEGSCKAEGSPR